MIKITQDNATMPLSKNKNLLNCLTNEGDVFDCNGRYISFSLISELIEKLPPESKAVLVVLSDGTFNDLLTEQSALRQYDSSHRTTDGMTFKINSGIHCTIISGSSSVNFIMALSDFNIVPEKMVVNINNVEIHYNKDLSEVDINSISHIKLINSR